jgi:hypothetical protein
MCYVKTGDTVIISKNQFIKQDLVGQSIFDIFSSGDSFNHRFINVKLSHGKWNYVKPSSGNICELYSYQ